MTPKEERADAISAYAEHVKTIRSETSPGYTGHERTLLIIGFAAGWDDALRRQPVVTGPERTLRDERRDWREEVAAFKADVRDMWRDARRGLLKAIGRGQS